MENFLEPPKYSEESLIKVIRQTTDIDDLCRLGKLLTALESAGDFTITLRMRMEIDVTHAQHIYGKRTNQ
ncbi:hypothetical protein IO90_08570 [Chryseobacterium sp. FH1]|nr:hypothetical protein IO90_08570 [Chryseobacterium sp. FH1]